MSRLPQSKEEEKKKRNQVTMETLEAIAAAIKEIDSKKLNLKKAFDDLQSHSSLLSSFPLNWSDLDAHYTHVQNNLTHRFRLLESLASTQSQSPPGRGDSVHDPPPSQDRNDSAPTLPESQLPTQSKPQADPLVSVPVVSVVARPELKALCENMDGNGLRKYINDNPKERELIRLELPDAIRVAPDPGLMVLEAVEGFYGVNSHLKGNKNPELCGFRRACVLLLEVLMGINVDIGSEVREKAKTVAFEWKQKVKLDEESSFEALGLLHLVAAYGLGCEFEKNDLVEYFVIVAKYRQSTLLCKVIGLGDKVQGMIIESFKVKCNSSLHGNFMLMFVFLFC